MNGITISKTMRDALPADERPGLDDALWHKSNGKCFLCGEDMNRASEILEADHDTPSSAGGETKIANLNLVHKGCNKIKKNHPTISVRPYLKLQAFVRKKGGNVRYDGAVEFFGTSPAPTVVSEKADIVSFEFADGSKRSAQIHVESRDKATFRYAFVDVPRSAIFNDDTCQPRALKLAHVWSILSDLQINPLHEPPACRLEQPINGKGQRLLMFDGQHKTVAYWLKDNDRIVVKVYLGMNSNAAITLVNSIQSKIKKLPLSPFELAAKLSDEWEGKLHQYEESVPAGEASEAGFMASFSDPTEKRRAKDAWEAALIQRVLGDATLDLKNYIQLSGAAKVDVPTITENTAKKKILEQLIHRNPLPEKGEEMTIMRDRELQNIVRVLNQFTQLAFETSTTASPQAVERTKRMMYQSSLQYCAGLLKRLVAHVTTEKEEQAFLRGELVADKWIRIEAGLQRMVSHPIWTADWNHSAKTKAVYEALQKNQNAEQAFEAVGLRLGFVIGADKPKATMLD
jgi:hypothetical protein